MGGRLVAAVPEPRFDVGDDPVLMSATTQSPFASHHMRSGTQPESPQRPDALNAARKGAGKRSSHSVNPADFSNLKHAAYSIGPTGTQRARLYMF